MYKIIRKLIEKLKNYFLYNIFIEDINPVTINLKEYNEFKIHTRNLDIENINFDFITCPKCGIELVEVNPTITTETIFGFSTIEVWCPCCSYNHYKII